MNIAWAYNKTLVKLLIIHYFKSNILDIKMVYNFQQGYSLGILSSMKLTSHINHILLYNKIFILKDIYLIYKNSALIPNRS